MAIFSSSSITNKSNSPEANTTIITAGTKITGEIELACNLYIDGEFQGNIISSKEVNVGKNGRVQGSLIANRVVAQGYIEGSVAAERVEIKTAGHINGEIASQELVIEPQGIFQGNSIVKNSASPALSDKHSKEK